MNFKWKSKYTDTIEDWWRKQFNNVSLRQYQSIVKVQIRQYVTILFISCGINNFFWYFFFLHCSHPTTLWHNKKKRTWSKTAPHDLHQIDCSCWKWKKKQFYLNSLLLGFILFPCVCVSVRYRSSFRRIFITIS